MARTKRVAFAFVADDAPQAAAAISFYAVTALSPLLVVLVSLAGTLVPSEVFKDHLLRQTGLVFGPSTMEFVSTVLAQSQASQYGWSALFGFLFLLVSGAAMVAQLQASLNKVWHIIPPADASWTLLIRDRLVAMAVVMVTGALLLSSLFASAWLTKAELWATEQLGLNVGTLSLTQNAVSFCLLAAMCALLFRMLPGVTIAWKDVGTGAALTAALFMITKTIFAFYLARANVTASYGQAGALVLLLLWVYFSSMIFLLGAEWTKIQAHTRGRTIRSRRRTQMMRLLHASRELPCGTMVVRFSRPAK